MRCAVTSFVCTTGLVTQRVNFADEDGQFIPHTFLSQSGFVIPNVVTSGGIPANAYCDFRGLAFGALGAGGVGAANCCADVSTAGVKDAGSMYSPGYFFADYNAQLSFGGAGWKQVYISNLGMGFFDITYDQNDRNGDTIYITVFGGTDLIFKQSDLSGGLHSTVDKPQGVISLGLASLSGTKGASTGTGGENVNIGWDTPLGVRGSSYVGIAYGADVNGCLQVTDSLWAPGGPTNKVQVTAWADTSFTLLNAPSPTGGAMLAVCGANIRCSAGVLTQPATPGVQLFDTGIKAKWIYFISNGYPANSGNQTIAQVTRGWGNRQLNQMNFWAGEGGTAFVVTGARYMNNDAVLRFGVANLTSTVFTAKAALSLLRSDGAAGLNWLQVDGVSRQVLWFAIGEERVPIDYTGLHFINPAKVQKHDSYNLGFENKIPDPTVRTALIGE